MMNRRTVASFARRTLGSGILALPMLSLMACDITNPGPIQDTFLEESASHEGLVNGARRALVAATAGSAGSSTSSVFFTSTYAAQEFMPGGQLGPGTPGSTNLHTLNVADTDVNGDWSNVQTARFIAENAITRFEAPEAGADPDLHRQAYIWGGLANRLLGAFFCEVTFDAGPLQPPTAAFERAEGHYTAAIEMASGGEQLLQALAGRAQVRALLGDWAGAAADAAQVPLDWEMALPAASRGDGLSNYIWHAQAGFPYRGQSVWQTNAFLYYRETGDPRVAYERDPEQEFSMNQIPVQGRVPFYRQKYKHNDWDAPIRVKSGAEMRLIQAEAILQQTPASWPDAVALINEVRTRIISERVEMDGAVFNVAIAPLEPYSVSSLEEAWVALMTEREVELWLEGQRFVDLGRWETQGVPGIEHQRPDWSTISPLFDNPSPARCFPVSRNEQEANPNIEVGSCLNCGVR